MRSFLTRSALLLTLLLIPAVAWATTYVFSDARCKLWLPEEGWSRSAMREEASPAILAAVEDDSSARVVVVMATRVPIGDNPDSARAFVKRVYAGYERGVRDHATITRSGETMLGGVPAWEIVAAEMSGGTSYSICAVANGRVYQISARWKRGQADKDEDLRSIVESFRFLDKPEIPGSAASK